LFRVTAPALVLFGAVGVALGIASAADPPPAPAPAPLKPTVKIVVQTNPPQPKVDVKMGKKLLGQVKGQRKPLIIERPRDSGPMDLTIRAPGYLPVHTRAYTFTDNKLWVKLTPVEERKTLFGYREELPPDGGATATTGSPDAGTGLTPAAWRTGHPDAGAPR
jgi:hypothetical protein